MIKNSRAFTLFEILIVFALIGVLMVFILPRMTKFLGKKQEAEIKFKITAIKEALVEYKNELGVFPTTREGLQALVTNPQPNNEHYKRIADKWPFIKEDQIMDKAGNVFGYHCPPEKKGKFKYFELMYLGSTQSEADPEAIIDGE